MKKLIFDGRLGKDAEVGTTRGTGKPYVRFSVANNSFNNGEEKTEWMDVTSYDPYVIENRVKFLTKGTYVIVSGTLRTEGAIRDGRLWINNYVNADSIETPNFGAKKEDGSGLSTYTGGTPSIVTEQAAQAAPSNEPQFSTGMMPSAPAPSQPTEGMGADNDLPF